MTYLLIEGAVVIIIVALQVRTLIKMLGSESIV